MDDAKTPAPDALPSEWLSALKDQDDESADQSPDPDTGDEE
jgi:hypothetical protein